MIISCIGCEPPVYSRGTAMEATKKVVGGGGHIIMDDMEII